MKKIRILFILIFVMFACLMVGCSLTTNNTIFNKSYSVDVNIVKLENTLNATIEKASPAVLGVSNYKRSSLFDIKERLSSVGSGFIYKSQALMKDGKIEEDIRKVKESDQVETFQYYLVTNEHVINSAKSITIYDGEEDVEIDAELLGADKYNDLAVLFFEYNKYIEALNIKSSSDLKKGDFVIAIGNPGGYDYYCSSTFGIVSSPNRYLLSDIDDDGYGDFDTYFIQHDAAINHGNSGGPLLDIYGNVVGVNVMKDEEYDAMGFAVPSDTLLRVIDTLASGTAPSYPTLGITGIEIKGLSDEDRLEYSIPDGIKNGIYVSKVKEGMGNLAGLIDGDIILMIDDVTLNYTYTLKAELNKHINGSCDQSTLSVYRNGQYITLTIVY